MGCASSSPAADAPAQAQANTPQAQAQAPASTPLAQAQAPAPADDTYVRKVFDACDKNADGKVTKAELASKVTKDDELEKLLGKDDVKGFGLMKLLGELMAADKDGNGALDWDEFQALVAKNRAMRNLFAALDKNGDNKVSATEFVDFLTKAMGSTNATVETAQQRIRFMDQGEKDGVLDLAELTTACESMDVETIESLVAKLA